MEKRLKDIAEFLNGELAGNGDILIRGVNGVNEADEGEIAFVLNPQAEGLIDSTGAGAVVMPKSITGTFNKPTIKVDNPSIAFSRMIEFLMPDRIPHPKGLHKLAVISGKAKLGIGVALGAYTVIEDGVSIGDNTIIYPFCYIGKATKIGNDCIIYPNVVIREDILIGDRVIVHSGTVIGSDGFGYDVQKDGTPVKIPQIGTIVIENDVEIGACVTVDRARFAKTVIGRCSKIDNLVQIAHNVIIGPNCLIAGQSGIAGSSEIGRNVVFGGQVGVSDHVKIGDFVVAGAGTKIHKSYPAKMTLFGYPAKPVVKARETIACVGLLPKLFKRVRALEVKIKELENK
ncbi:MAG: UDP-3-O-(3-hydroxymyristoyl)glucosamine N-acyltransferase [Candidatus Omnitrophota bacterium]|nr:UDP-3-O-(3-hydroxymyristoyl)glucosamine N-acyltransferase [Candidatus Omnitrophota bacterium]